MGTAQHCFCILHLFLFAGLLWMGTAIITIYTAKSPLKGHPYIYNVFPGEIAGT